MFTGPVVPVEVFFYWPKVVFGNFYWPGAIGSPLASSPAHTSALYHINVVKSIVRISQQSSTYLKQIDQSAARFRVERMIKKHMLSQRC